MDNKIEVFKNEQFGEIRTALIENEPWFVAVDVCRALEIGNSSQAISRLDADEKMITLISNEGNKRGNIIRRKLKSTAKICMRNVGGISQTEAMKSSDLYMKCRYLDELTGGRGVVFATGTPISNSMVEMYTMQKYLQYGALRRNDLLHFDAWASTFGETVTAIELSPEGTGYRAKTRFAKFYNLPELMSMFKETADLQTADMLKLPVPEAHYHSVVLKPSETQKEMVAGLSERAERVRNKMVDSSVDNMLLITNDGRKLALDQRLMNDMLPNSEASKVGACAENVFDIWQRTADRKSTQMVFCDLSTPHGDGKFNVYDDLRNKLIAKGVPAEEIAYIHTANSEAQKKELFGKVRSGQVRVLIGSTQKMGAGTNVQTKLAALHHLDCPWRPSDLQQREGRIIHQGNSIFTPMSRRTPSTAICISWWNPSRSSLGRS